MQKLFFFFGFILLFGYSSHTQVKEIDALIQPYVRTNNFSGSVLVSQNEKVIFSKSYGLMNRSYNLANTKRTKFFLASVSMIFTSAAIMKLVEDKKLSLDEPLSKFLPGYKYGDSITIHMLMSQRSGIPPIGQNRKVDYDSITRFHHTIEQLTAYFRDDSLLFAPGTRYNHGRSDYILLAYIIEKLTGRPFGAYLREVLFEPLHMYNTGHSFNEKTIIPNLAAGYVPAGHYDVENADHMEWSSKTGHASIYATAEDLNKFAGAILSNRVLSKGSWQKIFSDHGNQVGYGWFIREHLDKSRVQMNGRSPGFSSYFGIYPDDKLVVIVLSNNYISLPPELGKNIAALVLKKPYTHTRISALNLNPEQALKLTGTYKFDDKFYVPNAEMDVFFKDGKLLTSWGALIPVDEGKTEFNKFILRSYWSAVKFIENSQGTTEAMIYDGFRGNKIKR